MKKLKTLFLFTFFVTNLYSQITKGNWLIGGNVNVARTKPKQ